MSKLRAIQITFALPTELTKEEERAIYNVVSAAARRSSTDDTVNWLAGYGSAHPPLEMFDDDEPIPFDDSVLVMECSARQRYDSERTP